MNPSSNPTDTSEPGPSEVNGDWEPQAWVYFLWVAVGHHVYCKIGYSKSPGSRYRQILGGLPEQPFKMHLLPCLSVRQAQLFEALLHDLLKNYKTRGEWFTHPNVKHFSDVLQSKVQVIFDLFDSFGYEPDSETIDLNGLRPVLYENGFVSHLHDPYELDGVGGSCLSSFKSLISTLAIITICSSLVYPPTLPTSDSFFSKTAKIRA